MQELDIAAYAKLLAKCFASLNLSKGLLKKVKKTAILAFLRA